MKKRLLLFSAPYSCSDKDVIAATLAWLAKDSDLNFEVYYEVYHSGKHFAPTSKEDHFGSTVLGGFHHERFYFLNTLFDVEHVLYDLPKVFSSSIKQMGAKIIAETDDLSKLYQKVFSYHDLQLPKDVVIVETAPFKGMDLVRPKRYQRSLHGKLFSKFFPKSKVLTNLLYVGPYCYPEIFYRRALGIESSNIILPDLYYNNLSQVHTLFLDDKKVENIKNQGFNVNVVDKFLPTDNYWSVTSRIATRWLERSKGITYCDPTLVSYWLPWLCRNERLAVYEVFMGNIRGQLRDLILTTGNKIIYGRHSCDQDITELSKDDIVFQIMDPCAPLFPVIEELGYQMSQPEKNYYEFEPSEDTLSSFAHERKILCSLLFYCPDVRHVQGLPHILELAALTKVKIGLGITAQWYKFSPETLELINVPIENGGVFPIVEPLLCSTGIGVGVEKFLKEKTLYEHLKEAKRIISKVTGPRFLPKGHYPFLDTIKDYPYSEPILKRVSNANPSFEAAIKSGFEYAISYSSPGKPKVMYKSKNFISINHTSKHWFPESPFIILTGLREIMTTEISLALRRKPGWILAAIDSPLWAFPYYRWKKSDKLFKIASYISRGGITGKLVNTTPHVISRYARLLDDEDIL